MKEFFRTVLAYTIRDAIMAFSYRLNFMMQVAAIISPVISIYFVSRLINQHPAVDPYGGYLAWAVIGLSMTSYFTTGYSSFSNAIRQEQMMGTLESVMMTPAGFPAIVIASSVWSFIWATISSSAMIFFGEFIFHIKLRGSLFAAIPFVLLTTLTFMCIGIVSASFTMIFKRGDPLSIIVNSLSFMLGGVFYPVSSLPAWLQKFSWVLPITHGLSALREVLLKGKSISTVIPQMLVLSAFVAVGLPVSLWCFGKAVNIARREGSLLHY